MYFGDKIHATVKKDLVSHFEPFLKEGESRIFQTFSLTHSSGSYRSTKHPYKILFVAATTLSVNFCQILDGSLSTEFLVDIIGQVVEVSDVEIVFINGKKHRKRSDSVSRDNSAICVLTFANINGWKDDRIVCNAYNVSALAINPSMSEVEGFLSLLPKDNLSLVNVESKPLSMKRGGFYSYAKQTIYDVLETRQ
ncbi:hypothetical protein HID58_047408, partial [Brassica napus]